MNAKIKILTQSVLESMVKKKIDLDFLFVLGPPPLKKISGGYNVVFNLAKQAQVNNLKVGILYLNNLFLKKIHKIEGESAKPHVSWSVLWKLYSYVTTSSPGLRILRGILRHLFRSRIDESKIGVVVFTKKKFKKTVKAARVISCTWESSYFVNEMNGKEIMKYQLIQYSDNPAHLKDYVGNSYNMVLNTFNFKMPKIVLNSNDERKFKEHGTIKLSLGIDSSIFYFRDGVDKKDTELVLVALRRPSEKGAETAIKVIELVHNSHPGIRFASFGDYEETDKIPNYIDHHGIVNDAELANLYRKASIFFLPSLNEAFGLTGIEAMASGCVLVCFSTDGSSSYVTNNVNGYIVPIGSLVEAKDSIVKIIYNRDLRDSLRNNGLKISKKYSSEEMFVKFIQAIEDYEARKEKLRQDLLD